MPAGILTAARRGSLIDRGVTLLAMCGIALPSFVISVLLIILLRQFKAILEAAKLPTIIRFHDLRHSCATFLIAQGVHPRVIMEILGHAQISTTMNIYSHVLPDTNREATDKLDTFLGDKEADEEDEASQE